MKKVMLIFGTRPEAIKMCPLVLELKKRKSLHTVVCVTGQHRDMLDSVMSVFGVTADHDLDIMQEKQTLRDITEKILLELCPILELERPDLVLVHGDTTTAYAAALVCFYLGIDIGHVEAGLRTWQIDSPFPEEFNRRSIDMISKYCFAPTDVSKTNLLSEGKKPESIVVTGNTIIDAIRYTVKDDYNSKYLDFAKGSKLVLLTIHRRENMTDDRIEGILNAVLDTVKENPELKVIFPCHPNHIISEREKKILNKSDRILLTSPLNVLDFHNLLKRAYLVLTDSGGVQEEATAFGIPALVLRDVTERVEGQKRGILVLAGTDSVTIRSKFSEMVRNDSVYESIKNAKTDDCYGDGFACVKIADAVERIFAEK